MKQNSFLKSLSYAFNGIRLAAKNERNFRIQLVCGVLAILACIIFQVAMNYFFMVIFAIFIVLSSELMNTAVEALTDLACKGKQHPLAKLAKDTAAGSVLLSSMIAIAVAIMVAISILRRYI